jgi:ribosome recycling factor
MNLSLFIRRIRVISTPFRNFSWKSRLSREPEIRERKIEALNKRYLLRRLDELDGPEPSAPGYAAIASVKEVVEKRLSQITDRVEELSNVVSIDREDLAESMVGKELKLRDVALSISLPNRRSAIIVVKDRGNTERVLKVLKRANPNLIVSLMDRERIEVKLPKDSAELREARGEAIDEILARFRKELKKLELQAYDEIKKLRFNDRDTLVLRENARAIFSAAEQTLDNLLHAAMEDLGIDFRS